MATIVGSGGGDVDGLVALIAIMAGLRRLNVILCLIQIITF